MRTKVVVLLIAALGCGDGGEADAGADASGSEASSGDGDGDGDGDGEPGCRDPFEPRPTPVLDLSQWVDGEMEVDAPCEVTDVSAGAGGLTSIAIECPFEDTQGTIAVTVAGDVAVAVGQVVGAAGSCIYVGGDAEALRPRGYAWRLALRDAQGQLLLGAADGQVPTASFDPLTIELVPACGEPTETEDVRAAFDVGAPGESTVRLLPGDTRVVAGFDVHLHRAELFACCEVGSWTAVTVLPE